MDSKQFRILIQMLEAIRWSLKGPLNEKADELVNKLASKALEDAESLEASEYFQEEHCNEHRRTNP